MFLAKILKSYLFDINRLHRFDEKKLKKYQDKSIQKMVKFAYTVPLYYEKYKKAGIHPNDITSISDIEKLPLITKEDIQNNYPRGIVSKYAQKDRLIEVSTSGTTGKSLTIFVDLFDVILGLFGYLRTVKEYGINWRTAKMSIIGDFASHTAESGYIHKGIEPRMNTDWFFKNVQWLDTNAEPKKNLEKINKFKPDFIGGYVGMLGHMALLKEQGYGANVHPKIIAATGSVLDISLRRYIEQSFQTKVYEVYGATETGIIAFECNEGGYHVMSDFLYLEYFQNEQKAPPGGTGKVVVTKLYAKGTPIIRYDAMNDIVASSEKKCHCGISGDTIQKIYGRKDLSLIFPNGRIMMPSAFAEIYSKLLYQLKTTKLLDTKIIQIDLNTLDIQVVINKKQKKGPTEEEIINFLQKEFQKKVGPNVSITIKEAKKLGDHEARIVSKINQESYKIHEYL
jgi:phenylacetate-CoA ligase